jgi:hypothetical protein
LLKHGSYITSKSVWPARYQGDDWDSSKIIQELYYLDWMRPTNNLSLPMAPGAEGFQKALPLPLVLQWKNVGPKQDRDALREHLDDRMQSLPQEKMVATTGDPRFHTAAQFRDTLREQFECEKLQLHLANAQMIIPVAANAKTNEDEEEAEPTRLNLMSTTSNWNDVRAALEREFHEEEIVVAVQFRLLDIEEDEKLFESEEPPPQLAEFIRYDGETTDTVESVSLDTEGHDQDVGIDPDRVV